MRLNLGSGPVAIPGWINIDRSPNVVLDRVPMVKHLLLKAGVLNEGHRAAWDSSIVRSDIRGLPYATESVDVAYSSHTLEHLYLAEAKQVLAEAARVLKPEGVLRLALPDATALARDLLARPDDGNAARMFNERLLAHPASRPSLLERLRDMAGGHIHRWQPTPALVTSMLREAGFAHITTRIYREGSCPDLDRVETRPESFFLEASKSSAPLNQLASDHHARSCDVPRTRDAEDAGW